MDDAETRAYSKKYEQQAATAADLLIECMPSMVDQRDTLLSGGQPAEFKEAFANALTELTGQHPGTTDAGAPMLDAKHLKMVYRDLPALAHYQSATGDSKRAAMAMGYLSHADLASRLHPLVSVSTITGRTGSQAPNLHNPPRGQDFRELFRAVGLDNILAVNKILAVDYSAIEMRIAAALAVRAYRSVRELITLAMAGALDEYSAAVADLHIGWLIGVPGKQTRKGGVSLIDSLVHLLKHQTDHRDAPPTVFARPVAGTAELAEWGVYYVNEFYRVCRLMHAAGAFQINPEDDQLTLRDVFARGLDPHVITAVSTEVRGGRFNTDGMLPLEYVAALSKESQDALKKQLKAPRQSAKAQNFGLLYGMAAAKLHGYGITNYGLSWTVEEATDARDAWFGLYPEVSLWHLLTRFNNVKVDEDADSDRAGQRRKLYQATTISGRPVFTDQLPAALNFQDQGTGAEIALDAISNLTPELRGYLVNFVHDELVFEIPENEVERLTIEVNARMIAAADRLLLPWGVPTEVEAAVGDFWVH